MSASLLRLFQSEYFNVHLAVSYLRTYKDSVGITYYLAHRLAQVDEAELEFYWPQLCHLLVSHASESGALEGLVIKKCEESIHLAMLTLWQMQASLSDLSVNPSTVSFATCRRLYNRAQHIIFSDALLESSIEACQSRRKLRVQRVGPALVGIGVAIAAVAQPELAAFQGQVAIEEGRKTQGLASIDYAREESIAATLSASDESDEESGRKARLTKSRVPSSQGKANGASQTSENHYGRVTAMHSARKQTPKSSSIAPVSYLPGAPLPLAPPSGASTSPYLRRGSDLPLRHMNMKRSNSASPSPPDSGYPIDQPGHSHSMVNLSTSPFSKDRPTSKNGRVSSDSLNVNVKSFKSGKKPLLLEGQASRSAGYRGQNFGPRANKARELASHASPRLVSSTPSLHPYASSTSSLSQARLEAGDTLPPEVLSLLLRSYACRSQLDLLTSLQDIATRLIVVPRLARLSALRAELTVLNHGLPRGCCLCLGCSGQGTGSLVSADSQDLTSPGSSLANRFKSLFTKSEPASLRRSHHRIVRISPSESVVLNSADRAPFLIHVEILEGDLDFDPSRRQNAEDIRSVMAERDGKISKSRTKSTESTTMELIQPNGPPYHGVEDSGSPSTSVASPSTAAPTHKPRSSNNDNGVSEVSSHDLSSSSALPKRDGDVAPEEVDLVEQMYGSFSVHDAAALSVGEYHPQIHNRSLDEEAWRRAENRKSHHQRNSSREDPIASIHLNGTGGQSQNPRRRQPMSIDDYAERMRMAAIMLAQLNASQQVPLSSTDAVTGAVGAGVGMGVSFTYGVGSVVGSVVGVGVDAVKAGLGSKRRVSVADATGRADSAGQATAGLPAPVDDSSAVAGLSNVSGSINPDAFPDHIRSPQARAQEHSSSPIVANYASLRHPRQRVLSAQEASAIRERIMSEMMSLEDERMSRMKAIARADSVSSRKSTVLGETAEEESVVLRAINKDDPSGSVLSESWTEKKSRIRKGSPYGHLVNWDVFSVIVKTGADLRQEQLAVQLIKEFGRIWTDTNCPHWIRYFRILVTSESTGLMETITDAVSVHSIKKEAYSKMAASNTAQAGYLPSYTLYDHFVNEFGQPETARYCKAQDAFLKSLASYSVITYLLQIKDRHNGNILVDKAGHVMHIDFGFMLSNSPGSLGFEMAPFKLSQDYIEILGGLESPKFAEYRTLLKRLFRDVRQHAERIIALVELMQTGSKLPCFDSGTATVLQLRERFQLGLSAPQLDEHVDRLVLSSAGSAFTRLYDTFQRHSQGVL